MEGKGSEPELVSREPSFSSYCSNTLAETAARISMEESSVQYHLDYDFEFDSLPAPDNIVLPVFNRAALLLNEQDKHVEAIKDEDLPSSLDVKNPEGVLQPVHYKKSKSIGSLSRQWSFTRFLRRSNSVGALVNSNNNNMTIEEEKEGENNNNNSNNIEEEREKENLGCHGFIRYMCPIPPANNNSKPNQPEEFDGEKLVVMEKKNSFKRSSTGSDGSDKRIFPVPDSEPEIVQLDKSQRDHVEVVKGHDDSTSSNVEKPEEGKYKKSKSTGTLSRRWSFKGLLRRSSSERQAPRSIHDIEEGEETPGMFSRCFSLSSRSSSKLNLEEGAEKLGSDGCMLHLCPCLSSSLPAESMPLPREAHQEKVALKEKKPFSRCSSGSDHGSKNNNSADLGKVDGYGKRPKLQNNVHKVYSKKNSESWKAASTPYRHNTIGFFAMVRPLVMLFSSSTWV